MSNPLSNYNQPQVDEVEEKPFGTSIDNTVAFTQNLRKEFLKSITEEDEAGHTVFSDDPDLGLRLLNDIDKSAATLSKLTKDPDDDSLSAKEKAAVRETLIQIGQLKNIKDISNNTDYDNIVDAAPPMLPDELSMEISQEEIAEQKAYDSLEDFNNQFADDLRERQSR